MMKTKILTLAACAALAFSGSAYADWTTGAENRFYVSGGEAAARISLTAQQTLKMTVSTKDTGSAAFYFLYGKTDDADAFALKLPALVQTEAESKTALVSVTPLVDTGNGKRYYILDTGAPGGCLIVSYSGGKYKIAFDASSVEGTWQSAAIEVQKKQLVLHLKDAAGKTQDHVLSYDKKSGIFTADTDASVSTVIVKHE